MKLACELLAASLMLVAMAAATIRTALAQPPAQCTSFVGLKNDAERKALVVRAAIQNKAERKDICAAVQRFYVAESAVVTFLEANAASCGVPEHAIKVAKENHDRTLKFVTAACTEGSPHPPSRADTNPISSSRTSVQLKKRGGTLVVPVQINGAITLDFTIDSGSADVSVPLDVFSTLRRTGTIIDKDITGEQKYVLADGSTRQSFTFTIRALKVGDKVVENVRGSVAPLEGSLLLGQSFLERFKSWSIDNTKHVLLLEPQ